jgi:hypothetical protein
MSNQAIDTEEARRLDERAERLRAQLRAKPGFLDLLRAAQDAERDGRLLTPEQVRERFEVAD